MVDDALSDALLQVHELQQLLLARQRSLKSKAEAPDLDVTGSISLLLDALEKIRQAELASFERLEKQTVVLTSLALLFLLAKLERRVDVQEEDAAKGVEAAWTAWPSGGSGLIVQRCKEAIANVLRLGTAGQVAADRLLEMCQTMPLATKRTVACLQELMDTGRGDSIRAALPGLERRCVDLLGNAEVSTPIGRLAMTLIADRVPPQSEDFADAVELLRHALLTESAVARHAAASHLLPLVVKLRPLMFRALYASIAADGIAHLATFLAVGHIGFSSGLVRREELPDELLLAAIKHQDSSLRAAVLVLLSDAPASALRLTSVDFDVINDFLKYDVGPSDGEFRQITGAAWMRILSRLRASSYAADRSVKNARKIGNDDLEAESYVRSVEAVLIGAVARLQFALLSLSPYRLQRGALTSLTTLLAAGPDARYTGELDKGAQRTFQQLKDQPSAGALWPFQLDICNARMTQSLLRCLMSTYDDVRIGAFALLLEFPRPLPGLGDIEQNLVRPAMALLRNRRESESSSGALIAELAWRLGSPDDETVLARTLTLAEEDVQVAERDLAKAAQTNPMHGSLIGVRQLLIAMSAVGRVSSTRSTQILDLVNRVWQVAQPVLCHASPEGIDIGSALNGHSTADHEDARAMHALNGTAAEDPEDAEYDEAAGPRHKVLLSASWRAAKEAAALLEAVVLLPAAKSQLQDALTLDQLEQIGELFATWLIRIRHRGAFSAIYPSYGRLCRALVSYDKWPEVQAIPLKLLESHLSSLQSGKVSITRRSAGLPYCILGALTGIRESVPDVVVNTITNVIEVASNSTSASEVRVHAINTLMVLAGDAELAATMAQFIERCFALSIRSFESTEWNVRNVAMLLFASLVQRVLGTRANTMSLEMQHGAKRTFSHDFFRKYPDLHPLLLGSLQRSVQHNLHEVPTLDMSSSLHAVLLLLGLLSTPARTPGFHDLCLAFIPSLQQCARSRVWRIREAAAQAVAGLSAPEDVRQRLKALVPRSLASVQSNNELHGQLLQILRPLQRSPITGETLVNFAISLDHAAPQISINRPLPVQEALFAIAHALVSSTAYEKRPYARIAWLFGEALEQLSLPRHGPMSAGLDSFLLACARLALLNDRQAAIAACLQSPLLHLQLFGLEACTKAEAGQHGVALKQLQQSKQHPQVRLLAMRTMSREEQERGSDFSSLLAEYKTSSVLPLQDKLLPLCAASATEAKEAETVLELIERQTNEDETEERRQAGVEALSALDLKFASLPLYQIIRMRILQEDDPEIRLQAELLTSNVGNVHGLRSVQDAAARLVELDGTDKAVADVLLGDSGSLLAQLEMTDEALFARERSNLFKDDAFEVDALVSAAQSSQCSNWPLAQAALTRCARRLMQLPEVNSLLATPGSEPFNLAARASFALLVYKLYQVAALIGSVKEQGELARLAEKVGFAY